MNKQAEPLANSDTPILIVDDNVQYTKVLSKILQGAFGYANITTVESVHDAFAAVSEKPDYFKLLFVDYNFPDGDTGGSLLKRLQANNWMENKVAFLITSEPTLENVSEAISAGALGVVAKPFDRQDLQRQLDKARQHIYLDNVDSF